MKISNLCTTTDVASSGMSVRDVFRICVKADVPAVPYRDETGKATGWVSLRHIMIKGCIPQYVIELAHLLGNNLASLSATEQKIGALLNHPIEPFVKKPLLSLTPNAPVAKAIAIMEKYKTNYLFVFDGDTYCGILTTRGLAAHMLEVDKQQSTSSS